MSNPDPLVTVYPSEMDRNQYLLIGLITGDQDPDEEIELRMIDSEQGQEEILLATHPDEYGYFYISGICTDRIDFTKKRLFVNFVHSGYKSKLLSSEFGN